MAARTTPQLMVALDVPGRRQAEALAGMLAPLRTQGVWLKVGLELFCAAGPDVVESLKALGFPVFLDLKFHDIPNTVAGAVRSACALGADMLTVHAAGGGRMLQAAVQARDAAASGPNRPLLMAVTVLTSMAPEDAAPLGAADAAGLGQLVRRLALLTMESGLDGIVSSPLEVPMVKELTGGRLASLTPGIRLEADARGDQRRTATPAQAAALGADYLVAGRPITAAPDPLAAAQAFLRAMAAAPRPEGRP